MKLLNNFLTSGHVFSDDRQELKTKFILLNSMLLSLLVAITFLTVIQWKKTSLVDLNIIFIVLDIVALSMMRIRRDSYVIAVYFLIIASMAIVTVWIIFTPDVYVRVLWFSVIIAAAFMLDGKRGGVLVFLASIAIVIFFFTFLNHNASLHVSALITILIIILSFIIGLYEHRQDIMKRQLQVFNATLEQKVEEKTHQLLEQKNAYKELAHYDALTGLPNRTLFFERLDLAIARASRNRTEVAILFIDLDRFKEINDLFGHQVGDEVLNIIASRLQKHVRNTDTLARLGGDEFMLILENIVDTRDAGLIAKKLQKVIAEPFELRGHEMIITSSIGIGMYPKDSENGNDLITCADTAMYSAKKNGCNLTHFYTSDMTDVLAERMQLETYIRRGIENDEFVVHYQPIIDAQTSALIGLEALARWKHPQKGLLGPDAFISVAEESALIIPLGEKILAQVVKDYRDWCGLNLDMGTISVNLSGKQLDHGDLFKKVANILGGVDLASGWLEFEITESYAFQDPDKAISFLGKMKKLGVQFSLDDFGTGYSSLTYLKKLPISKVKIDRSFVKDILSNPEDEALVRTIISMAKNLDLMVVAEGVETQEQLEALKHLQCDYVQGYLFSKPQPKNDITNIIITNKGLFHG